jgi:regulatory protein
MGPPRPEPTLRGKALRWLSQREHSRQELTQKLQRWLTDRERAGDPDAIDRFEEIEPLLDALASAGHLSDERFVESRVNARSRRFGNRRIEAELRQHGTEIDAATKQHLQSSEAERARRVLAVKFEGCATESSERARRARFLAGRGFSSEAIKAALSTRADDAQDPGDR